MRLEHLEVHLNELFHDLNSPLSSMRLQLGLLREETRNDAQLLRRVEITERQLMRIQHMLEAFAAACASKPGHTRGGETVRRIFERFGIPVTDMSGEAEVAVRSKALDLLIRSLAEGCHELMEDGTREARIAANEETFVVRVAGHFDQQTAARAIRLSFVTEDGEPKLALASARVAASAANGTLLLERDAVVLRLPLGRA